MGFFVASVFGLIGITLFSYVLLFNDNKVE